MMHVIFIFDLMKMYLDLHVYMCARHLYLILSSNRSLDRYMFLLFVLEMIDTCYIMLWNLMYILDLDLVYYKLFLSKICK